MANDSDAGEKFNERLTIGVVTSCLLVSAITFGLRIYSRLVTSARLWWDDWWMFVVMLISMLMSASDYVGVAYGSGKHQADLSASTVRTFRANLWIYMLLWTCGVFAVKVGILLFYWRVFPTRSVRISVIAVGCFSALIFLCNFFVFILQCIPIEKFIDDTTKGHCINQTQYYLASAIINVFGDVTVLSLPIPVVWRLHTSTSKKWSISFLFLLGAFVCVASVFRIVALEEVNPVDFTFTNVLGGLWSTVEVDVGFICANLPAVRPVVFKWFGLGSSTGYATGSTGNGTHALTGMSASRTGHLKLHSTTRDAASSQEALTTENDACEPGIALTSIDPGTRRVMLGGGGIVVQSDVDVGVSVDSIESGRPEKPDHFVKITSSARR